MPITKLPTPETGMTLEQLVDLMYRYQRELQYLINGNLDDKNVSAVHADWVYAGGITTNQITAGTAKIGTALIEDLVVGTNVQIGSAEDAAGVTTIIGNTVTTTFVNALSITAGSVAAENITGTKITGKTIVGGKFMNSAETYKFEIGTVGSDVGMIFSESDGDKIFGVYDTGTTEITITGKGNIPFLINDGTFPGKTYPYGGWDFGSCTVTNLTVPAVFS